MAYRRRRKSRGTKGMHCTRKKRVRLRGGGTALRCAHYAKGSRRGYRRGRKPRGMARRGSHCVRMKRVRVRGAGMQRRCAKYGR